MKAMPTLNCAISVEFWGNFMDEVYGISHEFFTSLVSYVPPYEGYEEFSKE